MSQTLKELLKPPFKADGGKIKGQENHPYLTAFYKNLAQGVNYDNTYLEWIAAALNEKYERDFSEPMRWIKTEHGCKCPKCKKKLLGANTANVYKYCPHCGQELDKPYISALDLPQIKEALEKAYE